MNTPRKRSMMEAGNEALLRSVSDEDDRMMTDDSPPFDGGLRRRRVGSKDDVNDDDAPLQQPSSPKQTQQQQQKSVVPLSMHLMRPFWHMSCGPDCRVPPESFGGFEDEFFAGNVGGGGGQFMPLTNGGANGYHATPPRRNVSSASMNRSGHGGEEATPKIKYGGEEATPQRYLDHSPVSSVTSMPSSPINALSNYAVPVEQILREYAAACEIYGCPNRMNPGVLTALRFSLPTLRVSGNFHDADMLALSEVLLKHCNGALKCIRRLDFTIAGREGKDRGGLGGGGSGKKGVRSHGAYALSKVLCMSDHIEEVYLSRNRIGPYGSSAIFAAASENASRNGRLRTLLMRGCRIRERGALAFAQHLLSSCPSGVAGGLREVDLSANRIGFRGCFEIEKALEERTKGGEEKEEDGGMDVRVDLEGNMVFQEVMNCVTHGLGVLLGTLGTHLLHKQIEGLPHHYFVSCAIYSASIIVLYTSSTLFHSFFALKKTKFIFQVFDKCAIYLLIAGSYTPFLVIALHHEPMWSMHLSLFIWACAVSGIMVEALFNTWKHKKIFSLAMYLGMGWSCMVCLPDLMEVLPMRAIAMLAAGGVAYTGGVPFFVRNNNLDHSIWHMFVLAGSLFHWLCVFWYVAIPCEAKLKTLGDNYMGPDCNM